MNFLAMFDAEMAVDKIIDIMTAGLDMPEIECLIRTLDTEMDTKLCREDALMAILVEQRKSTGIKSETLAEVAYLSKEIERRFTISNLLLFRYKQMHEIAHSAEFKRRRVL